MAPPPLGRRILARTVDGLLVAVVAGLAATAFDADNRVFAVPLGLLYETVAIGRWGATVGKRWFGISVVPEEGLEGVPGPGAAAVRALVLLVPLHLVEPVTDDLAEWALLLFVLTNGYVVATRRDDRRGLHDLAAGTRPVVAATA